MMFTNFLSIALIALGLSGFVSASPVEKRFSAAKIQANRDSLCLAPFGPWKAGTRVGTIGCSQGATWDINPGSGSIILHGTTWALEAAGGGTANNQDVVLAVSSPGKFAQTWYSTTDNRIAITGGTQCLDEGANGPQTYQCTTGNTNQAWTVIPASGTPPPNHTVGRVAERAQPTVA